ncbi:nitrogen fixation protein FixI (plasmid) [Afipia carboxidovorans OM5]|uniref:Nitrogen fixation protein FixI n=1 Tax=Afipia carboxidovorans (strain ATCC 49405 / DSM 1227 / KCTC 32145 / OM5) TaxID=504832 RepID=F8C141_AFIC5|nr:heavy metal translocating P-type ATPase [Afipia carboxidovorans]AEI04523.1 nitrogen fixation protein FixI [Afipia carboxidovorans OM4]AEI08151.1 nitrogen fixation protein FixI [Afipia carboxidovorans OM5]
MTCCTSAGGIALTVANDINKDGEILLASRVVGDGLRQTDLSVPSIHCGACIRNVETALAALPGVEAARVNLSTRRATIRWRDGAPPPFIETLRHAGYEAHVYDAGAEVKDTGFSELIRALAVAGFAASNIMLLSVSVWSGADSATRDLFHAISAAIALPTLAYSGRVFFRSAWRALRHGRTNMDVPISIGVLLAFGMSIYETATHGPHAYFDASVTLLFFLLIGRTLDHLMREKARTAVKGLANLAARGALVLQPDGSRMYMPVNEIAVGMTILLAAGERVPVDANVLAGHSDIDSALLSGESTPVAAAPGMPLQAGVLNLTGPLTLVATAAAKDSTLADMVRLMEAAEMGRSHYRRIADRASQLYAPVVHATAFLTFVGWMIATGDIHRAVTIAIAVLIITCPCALGLAVPMVQVMAARRLFENGILLKDGGALERLAEIDAIVFDKTGTLTSGIPRLIDPASIDPDSLKLAAAIAVHSRHPYSRAIEAAYPVNFVQPFQPGAVTEHPGCGLEARIGPHCYRLGRAGWALSHAADGDDGLVLAENGAPLARFQFEDRLREGTSTALATLKQNFEIEILSGDHDEAVSRIADTLGLRYSAGMRPAGKVAHIRDIETSGRKVLMVGDGLNDAPALAAAHASMAPATAADIGRNAADLVFLHENLDAVPRAIGIARAAARLVRENLSLAVGYNLIAVPVAIMGYVTPLVAAIAMSSSSIIVIANALRLGGRGTTETAPTKPVPLNIVEHA